MDLDDLNARVTEAILRAERLPTQSDEAKAAFREVGLLEESIAALMPAGDLEGEIARLGAVTAALSSADPIHALGLVDRYLAEAVSPEAAAKLEALRSEADAELADGAAVQALADAARGNLRDRQDARAVRELAVIVCRLDLRQAAPVLHTIAKRGALGGRDGGLAEDVESAVLGALAGLQEPRALWAEWCDLWRRGPQRLWSVAATGMRRSSPEQAILFLVDAVYRAIKREGFALGPMLWAFVKDPQMAPGAVADELEELSEDAREHCRVALRNVGALENEIDAWVPAAPPHSNRAPAWTQTTGLYSRVPPRPAAAGP